MKQSRLSKIVIRILVFLLIVSGYVDDLLHIPLILPERAQAITYTDTFSADGTWTAPSLTTEVTVEAWGAGGAGAGESANTQYGQGGGGGGAYSAGTVAVVGGTPYTVVVGTGGTAGTGAGGDGGDSYFNDTSTILAKGGTGGNGDTGGTGGQASASVGTTKHSGGDGGDGGSATIGSGGGGGGAGDANDGTAGGDGSGSPTAGSAGAGGSAGGGDGGAGLASESNGNPGSIRGGGGGGAYIPDATNHSGGAGANGFVKVTYTVNYEPPELVGIGAQTAGTTSPLSAALPSGIAAGDLLLLIIVGKPSGTAGTNDTITPPGGWTQRGSRTRQEIGTDDLMIEVWYKIAGTSESDPSTSAGTVFTGGTSEGWSVQVAAYRNVDTSSPFDIADPSTAGSAAAATLAPPNITTIADYAMVVSIVGSADTNDLGLDSGNEQSFGAEMSGASYDTTSGSDHAVGLADRVKFSLGDTTMPTWRQNAVGNDAWVYFSDALKAAVPDHTWDTSSADFEIWQSSSLTWDAGTLICGATLTDTNASTVSCSSGSIAASTQYRVQAILKNAGTGGITRLRTADDYVDHVVVKGGWAGANPTLGTCGFNDIGSDNDASPTCAIAWNATNNARITNTSATDGVIIAANETEGFMYLITTDADAATNSSSYMNTSIDGITEDSSKITINGPPTGTLSLTASSSISFDSSLVVQFTSQTSTVSNTGALQVADDRGGSPGWTLGMSCNRWVEEDGTLSLRCKGTGSDDNHGKLCVFPANANLYAESGSLTGVSKGQNECFSSAVTSINILTATAGNGTGIYWLTDRTAEQFIPENPTAAVYTTTITYTLSYLSG
ncbi:MAG: hypothetical protein HY422_00490 [Candidatus Komeilibacteria bacterium]|nr:hypothetical protein [Candidatus Komeilibacteria bacterium]